jgi:hypothetical protein
MKLPPEVIKYLTKNSKKGVKKRLGGKSKEEISKIMKRVSSFNKIPKCYICKGKLYKGETYEEDGKEFCSEECLKKFNK